MDATERILAHLSQQFNGLVGEDGPSKRMLTDAITHSLVQAKEPEPAVLKTAQKLCEQAVGADGDFLPSGKLGLAVLKSLLARHIQANWPSTRAGAKTLTDVWCTGALFLDVLPPKIAQDVCNVFFRKGALAAVVLYAILITASAEKLPLDDTDKIQALAKDNAAFTSTVQTLWEAFDFRTVTSIPPVVALASDDILSTIDWIGFDLDFTLIEFYERKRTELIWQCVAKAIKASVPAPDTPVRAALLRGTQLSLPASSLAIKSCAIDVKRGNLLKLNEQGKVDSATHGTRPIDADEVYGDKVVCTSYLEEEGKDSKDLVFAHTEFELPIVLAFALLVDELGETDDGETLYRQLLDELSKAFILAQSPFFEGSYHKLLMEPATLSKLVKDQKKSVRTWLEAVRRTTGKRMFVITDAKKEHVEPLMAHAFGPGWLNLFEFIVTDARKGRAFYERLDSNAKSEPKRGLLIGGNAYELGIEDHSRVLYFGDHAVRDVILPKKKAGWRAVGVLSGLEDSLNETKGGALMRMFSSTSRRQLDTATAIPMLGSSYSCLSGLVSLLSKEVNDHADFAVPSMSYCAAKKLFL